MEIKQLKIISEKLGKVGKRVYIVWGYTREKILGWDYGGDIDLATDASVDEMKENLRVIKEVWKKYGTMIVKEWDMVFELTSFRKDIWILDNRRPVKVEFTDSLEEDSSRRDFSFNAIYYDVASEKYIDPHNWIQDLNDKIIRFIWLPTDRIKEDALRILRFIRFKNRYSFWLWEENYLEILKQNIWLLKNISIERIKEEFDKILMLENNIWALKDLKYIWFFDILIKDVDSLEKTPGCPKHHLEWNVWIHTLMTIWELNKYFLEKQYSTETKLDLYWTMLLHDIWKNTTFLKDYNNNVHYYGHEQESYHRAKEILKQFKFSNKSTKKILWLIENHLRVFKVFEMKTLKARKFMMHEFFKDLIIVWIVDHRWRIPTDEQLIDRLFKFYNTFIKKLKNKKFLNWTDILKKYPDLEWVAIKNKLEALNDSILQKD